MTKNMPKMAKRRAAAAEAKAEQVKSEPLAAKLAKAKAGKGRIPVPPPKQAATPSTLPPKLKAFLDEEVKRGSPAPKADEALPAFLDRAKNGVQPLKAAAAPAKPAELPAVKGKGKASEEAISAEARKGSPAPAKAAPAAPAAKAAPASAMPLTGKAALRAIAEAASKGGNVVKLETGMTAAKAKAAAEKAKAEPKAKAAPAPKAKAEPKAKPAASPERSRYDWSGAEEAAAKGKLPAHLDFSADTHKRFRPHLAKLEELAKAGDLAGLKRWKWESFVSSSPKAMIRWRDICVAALAAKAKR